MTEGPQDQSSNDPTEGKRPRRAASRPAGPPVTGATPPAEGAAKKPARKAPAKKAAKPAAETPAVPLAAVFQAPDAPVGGSDSDKPVKKAPAKKAGSAAKGKGGKNAKGGNKGSKPAGEGADAETKPATEGESSDSDNGGEGKGGNRRRRRGGRGRRRKGPNGESPANGGDEHGDEADAEVSESEPSEGEEGEGGAKRRRSRTRTPREAGDESTAVKGSTRLEAKKQRRREGRETGRRRAPILTESEFLARRENVHRTMVVREIGDRVQVAVLEDNTLVEHYVNRHTGSSMIGNVYLGRIQNVLPGMEAAFVDIGRGRNAVLYAGEVNWDAAGLEGQSKRIEMAFKTGDPVLVQVTKDPVGQKGARLTAQISLPGRFVVYVPDGSMTGISRKLPERERNRLKGILRSVLPDEAGVIVRTAAEGAAEEDLKRDVARLTAQWEDIVVKQQNSQAPALLYSEPDLAIRVVRDIFNEDFNELIVAGADIYDTLEQYVSHVAPDLAPRIKKWVENGDVFAKYRIDEQIAKALDRKVWLPSGGSLVIDRTEAMTVIDVNTGKFTGEGGNLEQTVTRNNLEAAEEIVRQLRLRDIGGIIVVDFIDMVLESNRDLVLRRLIECLGRDRTKHQVAEVTSLGLVQMTRKRIGQGLLETFSEPCEACHGRGVKVRLDGSEARVSD